MTGISVPVPSMVRSGFILTRQMQISLETIYRSLFVQARGGLKRELLKHLRTRQPMRRSKHASTRGQTRGQIVDAISIRGRPAAIAGGTVRVR